MYDETTENEIVDELHEDHEERYYVPEELKDFANDVKISVDIINAELKKIDAFLKYYQEDFCSEKDFWDVNTDYMLLHCALMRFDLKVKIVSTPLEDWSIKQ